MGSDSAADTVVTFPAFARESIEVADSETVAERDDGSEQLVLEVNSAEGAGASIHEEWFRIR